MNCTNGSATSATPFSLLVIPISRTPPRPKEWNESESPTLFLIMQKAAITAEVLHRADSYLKQSVLLVDYYRIRQRLAFPLNLNELTLPEIAVSGIAVYPWATWYAWALEERIVCLGWAAQWTGRAQYQGAAARDLAMLASWPRYRQYEMPDLCSAHFSRILWMAGHHWTWLDEPLRKEISQARARLAAEIIPLHRERLGETFSRETILQGENPHFAIANIPFIGAIGAALAASGAELETLNRDVKVLIAFWLEMRDNGFSEGVCYDGYVLDFLTDWLTHLPPDERVELLDDERWSVLFTESLETAAPGDLMQVATIGDIEPLEMPFHVGAHAKLQLLQKNTSSIEGLQRRWYFERIDLQALRADALAALSELPAEAESVAPSAEVCLAQYAVTLRSGWEASDVAVVVAASNSLMGHVPANYGSLCMGTAGNWLIQTPGYQQYIPNSEREFTIGQASRNTPILNKYGVSLKAGRVLEKQNRDFVQSAVFDLSDCYPATNRVTRSVTLLTQHYPPMVLVKDHFGASVEQSLEYYWHGHPEAAWWAEKGWAMLSLNGSTLWFTSPQFAFDGTNIQRLRGSRGQLTLATHFSPSLDKNLKPHETVEWLFIFQDEFPGSPEPIIQNVKALQTVGDS